MSKMYALDGVNNTVEFDKDGHVLDASNASHITLKKANDDLVPLKIGASTASDEAVTGAQLDAVKALAGGYLAYGYDASGNVSQLSGQGSGDSGAIRYMDTFKVTTGGTFLGASAEVGDFVIALVADADTTDNTASNTDWLLDTRRTAQDLADGVTTDYSGDNLIVKDSGVDTTQLADAAVTLAKMDVNSVDSDQYVDRSIDGVHIAVGTIIDENVASSTLTKAKLASAVQTTLTNADDMHNTELPNLESVIGASIDLDTDSTVPAHSNYATATNLHAQIGQLDSQIKTHDDTAALRKVTATYNGGAQNVGSSISSGRVIKTIMIKPSTVANGANCTVSIGVSGDTSKYVSTADVDLYDGSNQVFHINAELASSEQIIATVTQGTATQGSFLVTVDHG